MSSPRIVEQLDKDDMSEVRRKAEGRVQVKMVEVGFRAHWRYNRDLDLAWLSV